MKASTLRTHRNRPVTSGMTIVELLCATAVMMIGLSAAVVTFIGVQRSFSASLYQIEAQSDQNRVFAYLRRDLRGASSVQASAQGTQLTLTVPIPTQSSPTFNLNLGLSLLSLLGPSQTPIACNTIRYYRQGTSIIREVNGAPTELSSSATQFQTSMGGTQVQITASFQPRYSVLTQPANSAATTATACVHLLNTTAP